MSEPREPEASQVRFNSKGLCTRKRRGEKIWKMLAAALAVLLLASLSACSGGKGIMFRAEGWDAEPNVPAGRIRFYTDATSENDAPVIERKDSLAEGQVNTNFGKTQ